MIHGHIELKGLKMWMYLKWTIPILRSLKLKRLTKYSAKSPDNVIYVPVDFETEEMGMKLLEYGYDPNKKTLFILEGLIMYIPLEAVENTLTFHHKNSGSGSSIIFDYYPISVVDGTSKHKIGHNIRKSLDKTGRTTSIWNRRG